jgi:hypothetical protein
MELKSRAQPVVQRSRAKSKPIHNKDISSGKDGAMVAPSFLAERHKGNMKTIKNLLLATILTAVFVGCAGDRYHRSTGAYIDDKATTAKVKADMFSDSIVKGSDVKVKCYQGKVQLSGFVDNQQQKDRAAEIARRVGGVQWVKNDLIVKTALPQNPYATTSTTYRNSGSFNEPAGAGVKAQGSVNGAGVSGSVDTTTKP